MLRFDTTIGFPRSLANETLHVVTARNTLYGLHKHIPDAAYDYGCTKTVLMGFLDRKHADDVVGMIDRAQRNGFGVNRHLYDNKIDLQHRSTKHIGGFMPLKVDDYALQQILQLCLLQYFDLYIAYDVQMHSNDTMLVRCYEFKTEELPNRGILHKFMEDMYHRNPGI